MDPLKVIERELAGYRPVAVEGVPRFHGGAVGYVAYDTAAYFERLPQPAPDPNGLPEAVLMLADTLVVFDHLKHRILVLSHVHLDDDPSGEGDAGPLRRGHRPHRRDRRTARRAPAAARGGRDFGDGGEETGSNTTREQYHRTVERGREHIVAGDIIQVVPSQRLHRSTDAHPFDIYRALRGINPSPYMFYVDLDGFQLVGASPETQVRVEDGVATVGCIAGTRPRGATPEEDQAMEEEMVGSPKERAEHVMLVDLARNDLGRVSRVGGVTVNALMTVERYSHVMHLESNVTGLMRDDRTCFDAFRACSPLGTVSGAPKIRAMEIIADLEPHRRGPYSGAIGYFGFAGNMDTCVGLRTLVMKDGVGYAQAGGGVVFDSDPEAEYQETLQKAGALIRAIGAAEAMDLRYGPLQVSPTRRGVPSRGRGSLPQRGRAVSPSVSPRGGAQRGGDGVILLIDNYDSFTYNLYQYLRELGAEVEVRRNDEATLDDIEAMAPERIVISPGPGTPDDAGISNDVIRHFEGRLPILGVCLGHQCIGAVYGGSIVGAGEIMHGKTSDIRHDGRGVFAGLPQDFEAIRYHSLAIDPATVADCLEVTAHTSRGVIMGVRHKTHAIEGVQFHPESILTAVGKDLLTNFLNMEEPGEAR